jgi:D-tyrosyl-tRNA(Tyr) deacylase
MRLVIQRVSEASVEVSGCKTGSIGTGLLILLGVAKGDTAADADYLVEKILGLRIFPDDDGKMNRDVQQANGALLIVSQFTLYGDCRTGRRPSFDQAAPPELAQPLYEYFVQSARRGPVPVETGVFQATMEVHLLNHGPVTIVIDTMDRTKEVHRTKEVRTKEVDRTKDADRTAQ